MAKFYNVRNGGLGHVTLGLMNVNSVNVQPQVVIATAAGAQLTAVNSDNFEGFTVAQTSAATDLVILPPFAQTPIGTKLFFFANSIARIKAGANASGQTLNGAADTLSVPLVVGGMAEVTRLTATNWMVQQYSSAGVVTSPTPS